MAVALHRRLVAEIDRAECPSILTDGERRRQLGSLLDVDVPAQCHRTLDDDLVLPKIEDLHSPDEIGPCGMGIGFVRIVIGVCNRDFDRTATLRDLLQQALPFMSSAS